MTKQRQRERARRRQADLNKAIWRGARQYEAELMVKGCEQEFLIDALRPFHATVTQALIPLYQAHFDGDNPANDPEDAIGYAVDLISDAADDVDNRLALAINDVYRDGADAALPHVQRAIEWMTAFERDTS
jgi:hypothetical protein